MGRVDGRPEDGRHRPVIEVALTYAGKTIPVLALVDSGADYTTIPVALGEALTGLALEQIGDPAGIRGARPTMIVCANVLPM